MPLSPGSRLGRYEVLSRLGVGGMGEVYRARDPRLRRDVAVKIIISSAEPSGERLRRFEDEARAAGALNHPNILSVFDVGFETGAPYVVFELLEGETVRERLERGPLPPVKAVEYAAQICEGLAAAHARGIVHRDLKPENLFITRGGRVKILDFGVAKLAQGSDREAVSSGNDTGTRPGVLLGTLAYMSPEQARGAPADARSDLFALGATLHEMLSGRPVFRRDSAAETLSAILSQDPGAVGVAGSPTTPGVEQIVRRCLEKNPDERFQSALDLGFALRATAGAASKTASATVVQRERRWPLLLGAGVALAVAVTTLFLVRRRTVPPIAEATAVPFTSFPGREVAPSFSPDGSQIAFAWTSEGNGIPDRFDLYVKVVGSQQPLRLTTRPSEWISPAWSPDGRQIAFSRMAKEASGIYVVPALGGPERKLLDTRFVGSMQTPLSWSPDGKWLAFSNSGTAGISMLDVETLERRRASGPYKDCEHTWMPTFSPDGRWLAADCQLSWTVHQLRVMPVPDGSSARVIARATGDLSGLTWIDGGRSLLFASDGDLLRVSVAGGEPDRVLVGRDVWLPAVSRSGGRLAYVRQATHTNIWRATRTDPSGPAGPSRPLISSSRSQRYPALSPDGTKAAFESDQSGAEEIWMCDVDGSNLIALTSFRGPSTGSPRWSPDGRSIAFDSHAAGLSGIYVVGVDGGPAVPIATGMANASVPAWSSAGDWLYFNAQRDGKDQIWKIRRNGGTVVQITRQGGWSPEESFDGRRVYYVTTESSEAELWSASVDGGDERRVEGMLRLPFQWSAAWALAASGVYFLNGDEKGIDFFDVASGQVRRVLDVDRPDAWDASLAVSRDGRTLLYAQVEELASDIVLIENFH